MNTSLAELGITRVGMTKRQPYSGRLQLPEDFDQNKFASKWALGDANLQRAKEVENIPGGFQVPGWTVWKDGQGKVCEKVLGSGKVVLMCRPKRMQHARNILYGRHSRQRINLELGGKSVAGESAQDPGMMTNAELAQLEREPVTRFSEPNPEAPSATVDAEVNTTTAPRVRR